MIGLFMHKDRFKPRGSVSGGPSGSALEESAYQEHLSGSVSFSADRDIGLMESEKRQQYSRRPFFACYITNNKKKASLLKILMFCARFDLETEMRARPLPGDFRPDVAERYTINGSFFGGASGAHGHRSRTAASKMVCDEGYLHTESHKE